MPRHSYRNVSFSPGRSYRTTIGCNYRNDDNRSTFNRQPRYSYNDLLRRYNPVYEYSCRDNVDRFDQSVPRDRYPQSSKLLVNAGHILFYLLAIVGSGT